MSPKLQVGNLFTDLAGSACEEITDTLAQTPGMRQDRIVSTGQPSPPNQRYNQPDAK